jgi:hypothetical protein
MSTTELEEKKNALGCMCADERKTRADGYIRSTAKESPAFSDASTARVTNSKMADKKK